MAKNTRGNNVRGVDSCGGFCSSAIDTDCLLLMAIVEKGVLSGLVARTKLILLGRRGLATVLVSIASTSTDFFISKMNNKAAENTGND